MPHLSSRLLAAYSSAMLIWIFAVMDMDITGQKPPAGAFVVGGMVLYFLAEHLLILTEPVWLGKRD